MTLKTSFSFAEIIKMSVILSGAVAFVWFFSIRPHTFDWQETGHTEATVKTLLSNSNVIGSPQINAVVVLEDGQSVVVAVPMRSDIRSGDQILLTTQQDASKASRKRYAFKSIKS